MPAALVAAGLLSWMWSTAAFTAQTRSVGNSWDTGTVTLTDDDQGVAGFSVSRALPGSTGTRCITVTSKSSVPGVVKVYVARLGADGLENNIKISAEIGTGGSFSDCTGFVPDAPANPARSLKELSVAASGYSTGLLPWSTSGNSNGETKNYRITWAFDTTGLSQTDIDALQGKSTSADVIWELQTP
jgi:hypothetical protein